MMSETMPKESQTLRYIVTFSVAVIVVIMGFVANTTIIHERVRQNRYLLENPEAFTYYTNQLIGEAIGACGSNQKCIDKWLETELPKYTDKPGFTQHDKTVIREFVKKQTSDDDLRKFAEKILGPSSNRSDER